MTTHNPTFLSLPVEGGAEVLVQIDKITKIVPRRRDSSKEDGGTIIFLLGQENEAVSLPVSEVKMMLRRAGHLAQAAPEQAST